MQRFTRRGDEMVPISDGKWVQHSDHESALAAAVRESVAGWQRIANKALAGELAQAARADDAESALAAAQAELKAEREAHAETRRERDQAQRLLDAALAGWSCGDDGSPVKAAQSMERWLAEDPPIARDHFAEQIISRLSVTPPAPTGEHP